MSCNRCGADVPADATTCPSCGAPARDAATQATAVMDDVGGRLARAARNASDNLAGRVPGRSIAVVGYAVLLLAVLLDVVPGSHGGRYASFGWKATKLGHFWDLVIPVLAGLALYRRLTATDADDHPALPAAVAALAAAQAYLLLDLSLIPLLVLAAAVILVYDAARTGLLRAGLDAARDGLERTPSRTTTGVALVLVAVAISLIPGRPVNWLGGVVTLGSDVTGTAWAVVLIAGGVAAIVLQSRREWWADWVVGGYVLLALAWAIVLFNLSLVPLLWLAGAVVASYDRYQRAKARTNGALTVRRLTQGTRKLVLVGAPLAIAAMSLTWSEVTTAGYFMGGYESSYSSYYGGYVSDYSFTKYYMPGIQASNTGFTTGPSDFYVGPLVVAALLALLVAALWVSTRPIPGWGYVLPAAVTALVALWWLFHVDTEWGPWAFLAGLALVGVATVSVALPTVRARTAPPA
ncbi:MAG TPA: zinc ribbon domain-containing protein [Frankiaceae bacterium]|jgi:hypothetical protein|nr:zinc ribbon domain-containing protein [Frankiaceae bacterium]